MLPYKKERGAAAFKRIKVYVGVPAEFAGATMESPAAAHSSRLNSAQFVTLGAVSTYLGAKF